MPSDLVLAIDQGTTSVRASILDAKLAVRAAASEPVERTFPQPGWVELDAADVVAVTERVVARAVESAGAAGVAALGLANQGETVVLWERKTGRPMHRAVVWQCRRTESVCARLRAEKHEDWVRNATGLPLDPYFSATKIAWLLDNVPNGRTRAARGELCAGTLDAYTLFRLSGGRLHVTDPSTSCRTLLARLEDGQFDSRLCELFGVPIEVLPEVVPSDADLGTVRVAGVDVRVRSILCDQPAALLGVGCTTSGEGKCTYGTGAFLQINRGNDASIANDGLLRSIAWKIGGTLTYLLEGSVLAAGDVLSWLRDDLGILANFSDVDAVLGRTPTTAGVVFVPALAGLGAPHWVGDARGALFGLSRACRPEHLIRAALEGVAHRVADVLEVAARTCTSLSPIWADGGLASSNAFLQLQADLLGKPLRRASAAEATTRGVAALAAAGAGLVESAAVAVTPRDAERFEPRLGEGARRDARRRHGAALGLMTSSAALGLTRDDAPRET
jgi:glycerol kinase